MPSNLEEPDTLSVSPGEMGAAVLFLVFNRPDTTAQVFAAIRAARPPRLYVAADGPRSEREEDHQNCVRVREIALAVDWPCEIHTRLREKNLGCRQAVVDALDWFFASEEAGIVLEDDCLPDPSFFPFCAELLERYQHDVRVMSVGGVNMQGGQVRGTASYYASKHFHCWGWASWRRAWCEYERDLTLIGEDLESGLTLLGDGSPYFAPYWRQILQLCRSQRVNSWAYVMTLSCFARTARHTPSWQLTPQVNLVRNIGFGPDATHTKTETNLISRLDSQRFPLVHPQDLKRCIEADCHTDRYHLGLRLVPFVKRQIALAFPAVERTWVALKSRFTRPG